MVVLKPLIIVMPQISFISGSQKGVNFFTERIWLTYTFQKAFRCLLGQIASTRPFIINKAARHSHLIEVYSFIKTLNDSNLKFLNRFPYFCITTINLINEIFIASHMIY